MVTNGCTGLAKGHDLGVGTWVGISDVAIPSAANDLASTDNDGPDWNFIHFERALGAPQGFLHPKFVGWIASGWLVVCGHARTTLYVLTESNRDQSLLRGREKRKQQKWLREGP
jgi:hypothetical protein